MGFPDVRIKFTHWPLHDFATVANFVVARARQLQLQFPKSPHCVTVDCGGEIGREEEKEVELEFFMTWCHI